VARDPRGRGFDLIGADDGACEAAAEARRR
jgi:hypothetical protein